MSHDTIATRNFSTFGIMPEETLFSVIQYLQAEKLKHSQKINGLKKSASPSMNCFSFANRFPNLTAKRNWLNIAGRNLAMRILIDQYSD